MQQSRDDYDYLLKTLNRGDKKDTGAQQASRVPVNPQSEQLQLPPIVQPIAFVPYSTQDQPLYMYDEAIDEYQTVDHYQQPADYAADYAAEPVQKSKPARKGVQWAPIVLALLGLVMVALLVVPKFVEALSILSVVGSTSGLDVILNLVDQFSAGFSADLIVPIAIAVVGVTAVLTVLVGLIQITRKGACVLLKLIVAIMLIAALVAMIMLLTEGGNEIAIGLYAVVGVAFVSVLVAFLARRA